MICRRMLAAVAFLTITEACSADITGNQLIMDCETSKGLCLGYIIGVIEGIRAHKAFTKYVMDQETKTMFCAPVNSNYFQAQRVVLKYLNDHPENTAEPAASIIYIAMVNAFPCDKDHLE